MFENYIHLRDELQEIVDIYTLDGDFVAKAELKLNVNKLPRLEITEYKYHANITNIDSITLNARTHNGTWYTLLNCTVYNFGNIYPKFIVKSKSHSGKFKTVKFVIKDLHQWFDNSKFIDFGDDYLTKYFSTNKFSISIADEYIGEITISSENWWETNSKKGEIYEIHQKTAICIESQNNELCCEKLLFYIYKIKSLLSILAGATLSVEYCIDATKKHGESSIYFANHEEEKPDFSSREDFLTHQAFLFTNNRWQIIFGNAFGKNKQNFINIWSSLPGLANISKYWDLELLLCVALVDKYTLAFSRENDQKLSKEKFDSLRKHIIKSLDSFPNLNDLNQSVINSIKNQIQDNIRNSQYYSFRSRFNCAYESIGENLRNIINFSENDFQHLKKLRDQIAHGDKPNTKIKNNITYENQLKSKLLIILYYWAFRDLGISESEFTQCLDNWLHPMVASAKLNKTILDRTLGHYKFLPVNETDFTIIKKINFGSIVLEYLKNTKNYEYRKDLNETIKYWDTYDFAGKSERSNKIPRILEEYLTQHVNVEKIHSLGYVNAIYIENGDNSHCIGGACILNPPQELIDRERFWQYDSSRKKWHQPFKK